MARRRSAALRWRCGTPALHDTPPSSPAPITHAHGPSLLPKNKAQVPTIEGLAALTRLRVLELGSNRIRTIEGLETLTGLQELWLGRNRIAQIAGVGHLTNLRKLSVQSNRRVSPALRISALSPLSAPP